MYYSKFIFFNIKLVFFVALLLYDRIHIKCFNIDTKFPIIYSRPQGSLPGRNSYFGFSLLLNSNWVQIGAPRANSSILKEWVMEPGVAFRCRIFGECIEVELDRNDNQLRDDNSAVMDLKNYSWIGGAMAMEHDPRGKVVVCGHRWKNQQNLKYGSSEPKTDEYSMSGICYISQYETDFIPKFKYTLPPDVYDKKIQYHDGVPYYGLYHKSQIGMSVYIAPPTEDQISLLIGAPGAGRYWSGAVLEYTRVPVQSVASRRRRDVEKKDFGPYKKIGFFDEFSLPYITQFNYFGYQVAAGYFFSKEEALHVAGAPRAENMKGLVAIYSANHTELIDVKKGQSFGEYFGSSIAVADVTGDGFDDLIVGAPFFSLHGDEGCIYVFTKSISFVLQEKEKKIGFSVGGRFGTSIASLGDIDQDGCEDIAVGAPYEESGVIYIYNGVFNGLSAKPSQRIKARDIHHILKGFGISISRPADIDGNKFTDVAIGSYLSEHVVLLRSFPVIELHSYLFSDTKKFNMSHTSFIVKACLYYKGSDKVPNNIEVIRKIDVDIKFHRFHPIPEKSFVLVTKNQYHCENITIQKKKPDSTAHTELNDIVIYLTQRLKRQESNASHVLWVNDSSAVKADKFCKFCPVVRQIHPDEIKIPYARECGEDGECESDAQLQCELLQNDVLLKVNEYIIGTSSNLKLTIKISNKGDPLYSPKVKVNIPKEVELAQMSLWCQDKKNISLEVSCGFGVIENGKMISDNISLDLSSYETLRTMSENEIPLLINVSISQDNYKDPDESNNQCNIKLNLIMEADVNITGKSERDEFFSESDKKGSVFTHIYEVSNVGISPLRQVQTFFHVPVEWLGSGSPIKLSSPSLETKQNGKSVFCHQVKANFTSGKNIYQEDKSSVKSKKGFALSDSHPSNRTFYVNCSTLYVKCQTWSCNFLEFKNNSIARIEIAIKFNISKLVPVMGNKDIIYFSSHGNVKMIESNNTRRPDVMTHHDIIVSSSAIGTVTDETIPLWIIILCVIAGILLIAAIIVGLAKAGFFKREKKEELKALKESEN